MATLIKDYPPNIQQIKYFLNPPESSVYTYGSAIYAPNHNELYPDVVEHEKIHQKQQLEFKTPQEWWDAYLTDSMYRLAMEEEAYAEQYKWLKGKTNAKDLALALDEMALALSTFYNLPIGFDEAKTRIRKYFD